MKATPTETDREAARLFALAPGMRAWCRVEGAEVVARVLGKGPVTMHAHAYAESLGMHLTESLAHNFDPAAIDTDDDATVGCMVAQLRAAGRPAFSTRSVLHADGDRIWRADDADGWYETEGASVVAEMRAVKGAT